MIDETKRPHVIKKYNPHCMSYNQQKFKACGDIELDLKSCFSYAQLLSIYM